MNPAYAAIDCALTESQKLRALIKKGHNRQVRNKEEAAIIRGTALAWFNKHRTEVGLALGEPSLANIDKGYKTLVGYSDKATSRTTYDDLLLALGRSLADLRGGSLTIGSPIGPRKTPDDPPDFTPLVTDVAMKSILVARWKECSGCIQAALPLAGTVMIGGLLEALLLARVHREADKRPIFGAKTAPRDSTSGKTLPLQQWTLQAYIDVAHELGWVTQSAKDIAIVLRDYRNYIHPYKELSQGVRLTGEDATLFWEIAKSITRQLLK